jgi:hypothetical protein
LVFLRFVRRKPTKAQPYLKPGLEVGKKVMRTALRGQIATLRSLNPVVFRTTVARAVRIGAFAALQAAQRKVPRDTGRLRGSLNARQLSAFTWAVGTNVRYARWVEEGTRGGQIIRPKRGKVLAFHWKNAPAGVRKRFARRGRRR